VTGAEFGDDFTWGVASAAFQIEGAWDADGKRPSVWDDTGHRGRIKGSRDGWSVGDDAIDAYHRYEADLDLIAAMGVNANRFSVSWPRVLGDGRGPWNTAGGDFYDRLIDAGLERGLEPWLTVHHWDLPLGLHHEGGWTRRGIVEDFAAYAEELARRYGDRVRNWMIFNEPLSVLGHVLAGVHTRWGLHPRQAWATIHHLNLAIAEAGRRMRDVLGADHRIGTTNVFTITSPYETDDPRLLAAKRAYEAMTVGIFLDPLAGLGYPTAANAILRPVERFMQPGDTERLRFDVDFMGVQYYGPLPIRRFPIPALGALPLPQLSGAEVNVRSSTGIPVEPDGLLEILRRHRHHPACRRMVITESGFGCNDRLEAGPDGRRVRDDVRIWYLRTHLERVRRAVAEGIPLDGYFAWSYADNVEWVLGRTARYGLVYVDYDDDLRRVPKDSYRWMQRLLTDPDGVD
jgi:beta-glucosidase